MTTSDSATTSGATTTGPGASLEWAPPGPGSWETDITHQSAPYGRFHQAVFPEAYSAGFAEGMAAIGSPLETIQAEVVNGWLYLRPTPLGGPDEPKGGPPPRFVFEVLFRAHPALRKRLKTARSVFDDRGILAVPLDSAE